MATQFRVTREMRGCSGSTHDDYPLLPGDILTQERDGRWMKHAPGIAIGGFLLSVEDIESQEEADDARWVIA